MLKQLFCQVSIAEQIAAHMPLLLMINPVLLKKPPEGGFFKLERVKGFEPSTSTLARSRSTPELRPQLLKRVT